MKIHKIGATVSSAAIMLGAFGGMASAHAPVGFGNAKYAPLPQAHISATSQHLCLVEKSQKSFQFGGSSNGICSQGAATIRAWQMSPRYVGSPILIELSATRESSITYLTQSIPAAKKSALNGKFHLDLHVSGGHFATAPGAFGATYQVSFGSMLAMNSVAGGGIGFSGPQFSTQTLSAVKGLKISGSANAIMLAPPIEPHPHRSHGSSGKSQSIQVVEWIPPAKGGILKWSYDGAAGTPIHVGAAQPVPKGWKISQAGSIAATPSIGASYSVAGVPSGKVLADLKAAHAAGYVDFTPRGGARITPTGQHALSLSGVIAAWSHPVPGQSVGAFADMNQRFVTTGSFKWPIEVSDATRGNWNPTDGLVATMVKDVDGRLITDRLTPHGTHQQIQTLRIAGGKGSTNKWIPITVHATKNGKPVNGLATLAVRSGPHGVKLQTASVFMRNGVGTDAVMAASAGTVALTGTLAGVHAVGSAQITPQFPWWILLVIAGGALGYGGYRYQRERKNQKNETY